MIFSDLQKAVADTLNGDVYLSAAPGCRVLWQGEKEAATGKALETAKAMQEALTASGVTACVPEPRIAIVENLYAAATITVIFIENIFQNRGDEGTGKTAYDLASKGMALLWNESFGPWGPLVLEGLDPIEVESEGCIAWALTFRTQTLLVQVESLLANELGLVLAGESGQPLLITPTSP